jgi:hypothetical protein
MCADRAKQVGYLPWEQSIDGVDRVIGDALKNIGQVRTRIDIIELATADQRVHGRRALASAIGAGEQEVLAFMPISA